MSSILLAIALVSGIGLVAGVGLAVAAIVMDMPVDQRVEQLTGALPGANCGACGFPGCAGYAGAIAAGAPTNLCTPGSDAVASVLAEIMGVESEAVARRKALVCCNGAPRHCAQRFEYEGEPSCAAASLLYGGQKQCGYGCLGFGDCALACPHGAIHLEDNIARVDASLCVGCALCARACPKGIIALQETAGKAVNRCRSEAPGPVARKQCAAACIGCGLCAKSCPEQAIVVENNLARVDPDKCTGCGLCVSKCPTKCLVQLDRGGALRRTLSNA